MIRPIPILTAKTLKSWALLTAKSLSLSEAKTSPSWVLSTAGNRISWKYSLVYALSTVKPPFPKLSLLKLELKKYFKNFYLNNFFRENKNNMHHLCKKIGNIRVKKWASFV